MNVFQDDLTGAVTRRNIRRLVSVPGNAQWVHFPSADARLPNAYSTLDLRDQWKPRLVHYDCKTGAKLGVSIRINPSRRPEEIVHEFQDGTYVVTYRPANAPFPDLLRAWKVAIWALFKGNPYEARAAMRPVAPGLNYRQARGRVPTNLPLWAKVAPLCFAESLRPTITN